MTAIVGVICKKGVVIGADSSVTFASGQMRTIEQKTKKIKIIDGKYIIAGTGSVGLGQRFVDELEKTIKSSVAPRSGPPSEYCRLITQQCLKNFMSTNVQQGQFGALFAFPLTGKHHLCEFDTTSLQPELKTEDLWYVSIGSGQAITDPFLGFIRKMFWSDGEPDLNMGIFATLWTLQHAVDMNTGGINGPIDIAVLECLPGNKIEARFLSDAEIEEHVSNIQELERQISLFTLKEANKEVVEIPKQGG
jgi:20S proteasome alpha/beta subunit